MLLKLLLVSGQHLPTQSSLAFPVIHLPMLLAAVPLSLLAKGTFCSALPFFPRDFSVVPFFFLIYWFWSEDFLTFSPLQLDCWVLYTIWRHLQRGWFYKIHINADFEWQNWVRIYNTYNSYVLLSRAHLRDLNLSHFCLKVKSMLFHKIFCHSWLYSSEHRAQSVRRHLLLMFRLRLSELLLLFITGAIGLLFTTT